MNERLKGWSKNYKLSLFYLIASLDRFQCVLRMLICRQHHDTRYHTICSVASLALQSWWRSKITSSNATDFELFQHGQFSLRTLQTKNKKGILIKKPRLPKHLDICCLVCLLTARRWMRRGTILHENDMLTSRLSNCCDLKNHLLKHIQINCSDSPNY